MSATIFLSLMVSPSSQLATLQHTRIRYYGAIIVLPAALALRSFSYDLPNEICEQDEQTHEEKCTPHDPLLVFLWHGAKFLDDFESAFVVLLTFAIAGFTFTLWRSTRGLWIETKRMAVGADKNLELLARTESAYVLVLKIEPGINLDGECPKPHSSFKASVHLQNLGKTPGFIELTSMKVWIAPREYDASIFEQPALWGGAAEQSMFIAAGDKPKFRDTYGAMTIEEHQFQFIRRMEGNFFVKGEVEFRTIQGEAMVSGFAIRIIPTSTREWKNVPLGGKNHWYVRQKNEQTNT